MYNGPWPPFLGGPASSEDIPIPEQSIHPGAALSDLSSCEDTCSLFLPEERTWDQLIRADELLAPSMRIAGGEEVYAEGG